MKIINRKRLLKILGLMFALLLSLTCLEVAAKFSKEWVYVGFQKRDNNSTQLKQWIDIAEGAEGNLSACQNDLDALASKK